MLLIAVMCMYILYMYLHVRGQYHAIFLQVLVEFWLNQNSYNGRQGDILAQAQVHIHVYNTSLVGLYSKLKYVVENIYHLVLL